MSHKEQLISGLQYISEILQASDENQTGLSQTAAGSGLTNEVSKNIFERVDELLAVARDLPNTDKQAQKSGLFSGPSRLLCKRPKRSKKVQVYLPVDTSKGFDAAFMKLCKDLSYTCDIIKNICDLQHDVPLIVVCPITSRFETDINHALKGLDWKYPFIALVLHQGNEHSLPELPTGTRLPDKPKYKYAEIVDLAFSLESKLYLCNMNKNARQAIKAFIDKFYK